MDRNYSIVFYKSILLIETHQLLFNSRHCHYMSAFIYLIIGIR